jgi:hypothetical protein
LAKFTTCPRHLLSRKEDKAGKNGIKANILTEVDSQRHSKSTHDEYGGFRWSCRVWHCLRHCRASRPEAAPRRHQLLSNPVTRGLTFVPSVLQMPTRSHSPMK